MTHSILICSICQCGVGPSSVRNHVEHHDGYLPLDDLIFIQGLHYLHSPESLLKELTARGAPSGLIEGIGAEEGYPCGHDGCMLGFVGADRWQKARKHCMESHPSLLLCLKSSKRLLIQPFGPSFYAYSADIYRVTSQVMLG